MRRLLCVVFLFLLIVGCAKEEVPLNLPSERFVKQTIRPSPPEEISLEQATESDYDISEILFNDILPGIGPEQGFGDGPWNHRIITAKATNPKVWTKEFRIVAEQASNPEALVDKEGRLRIYFIDAKNKGTTVAIKHDDRWIYKKVGIEDGATDTSVVITEDGMYRAYYQLENRIFSANSKNGVYFDRDSGMRISGTSIDGFDVFKAPEGWKIIFSDSGKFFSSDSPDGLSFGTSRDTSILGYGGDVLKAEDEYIFFYYSRFGNQTVIYSASSKDGSSWMQDSGVRLLGGSRVDKLGAFGPAAVKLGNGYKMAYYSKIK
ncbi:MAG TPA: hypothetical protein VJI46_07540 [Candidatus Nanoarchaeia archaeon]|nr:hypothetical protein [Candidatus Nanoarchaeia archaeon]